MCFYGGVKMKIAIDIGHNAFPDIGAASLMGSEDKMAMNVGKMLIQMLTASGYQVVNVMPDHAESIRDSLEKRVDAANKSGAELFVSIHMNAGGASGTEVWIGSEKGRKIAEKIVRSIGELGFKNRGIKLQGKDGKGLYVLKNTRMTALLVEGCFLDSREDMKLYNSEKMASAICRGIIKGLNCLN